jgi:hypothetical protein
MVPEIGFCTLEIVLKRVDFPMPFFPKTLINFPFSMDRFISEKIILFSFFL